MCGFTGCWSKNAIDAKSLNLVQASIQKIQHRGPDAQGLFANDHAFIAHARLAIVDLDARSNQPMTDPSNRYVLAFNGEIYNHKVLRQNLENTGVSFRTASDTEVLLHLLILYNTDAFAMLDGCFAFVFFDTLENRILAARDQMGINPLWFSYLNENLVFASELKGLPLSTQPEIDQAVLANYLKFGYCPDNRSIYRGVFKLKPGHFIDSQTNFEQVPWFSLCESFEHPTAGNLKQSIQEAVHKRLLADVPVGCFLSGGIDSSIVAAIAANFQPDLHTFSIGFQNHPYLDESNAAELVAKHIGSQHHSFKLSDTELIEGVHTFLSSIDEPFADSSSVVAGILSFKTSKFVKVVLSGDGADELFGGYRKHRALALAFSPRATWIAKFTFLVNLLPSGGRESKWLDMSRKIRRLFSGLSLPPLERYVFWASFSSPENWFGFESDYRAKQIKSDELNQVLYNDQKMVLPGDMLHKVDSMSMLHGLEVRVPFLDKQVVAIANGLPGNKKYSSKVGKIPLRHDFKDLLPSSVFTRPKRGFEIPLEEIVKSGFQSQIDQLSNSKHLEKIGLDLNQVKKITSSNDFQMKWHLLVLECWLTRENERFFQH